MQAQFLIPIAITIVFGLGVATLLILFVVPSLTAAADDLAQALRYLSVSKSARS